MLYVTVLLAEQSMFESMNRIAPYLLAFVVLVVLPMQVQAVVNACCYDDGRLQTSSNHDCCPSGDMTDQDMDKTSDCHCQNGQASASAPAFVEPSSVFSPLAFTSVVILSRGSSAPRLLLRPPRIL